MSLVSETACAACGSYSRDPIVGQLLEAGGLSGLLSSQKLHVWLVDVHCGYDLGPAHGALDGGGRARDVGPGELGGTGWGEKNQGCRTRGTGGQQEGGG